MPRTSAWPLALSYLGLIVYASLFPFGEWRDQGLFPLAFLMAPPTPYWTAFDVGSNLAGYFPLGFLLTIAAVRSGRMRHGAVLASLAGVLLSLVLESLQSYLPTRVASNADWLLNSLGACLGAASAHYLEEVGALSRWNSLRARWFTQDASGGLVLLALWPVGLLFPVAIPFGLGHVFERVEAALAQWLSDTPFLGWLPQRELELQPLVPFAELGTVALGLLIPCMLACCIVRTRRRRLVAAWSVIAVGMCASVLSAAMSYSPRHAWDWLQPPVMAGIALAAVLAVPLALAGRRASAALALLAMGVYLAVLNHAPADPYFALTLQGWEQGRFIRFNGVAQWVGWLWPFFATLLLFRMAQGQEGSH